MFRPKKIVRETSRQTAVLEGKEIPYTLIRSSRARRLSLKIAERSGLEVIVPLRSSLSHVPGFVFKNEQWILRHLGALAQKAAAKPELEDGAIIHVLGEPKTVRFLPTRKKHPYVKEARVLKFSSDAAYYDGTEILIYADSLESTKQALEKHLRAQARRYFEARTSELAAQMGTTFNRITIKGQKWRWGSCSREKNLNFNWRLIFASLEIIDSIILHELAHTVYMSHGKRFYALLEKHCPNHRELSRRLKDMSFIM